MLTLAATACTPLALPQLEASHRVLDLYLWLGFRFPDAWVGMEEVAERRAHLARLIDASIRSMGVPRWGWAGHSWHERPRVPCVAVCTARMGSRWDPFCAERCPLGCTVRRRLAAAQEEAPTDEQIAALAAALEQQRQQEWQQRRSSYKKRPRERRRNVG